MCVCVCHFIHRKNIVYSLHKQLSSLKIHVIFYRTKNNDGYDGSGSSVWQQQSLMFNELAIAGHRAFGRTDVKL